MRTIKFRAWDKRAKRFVDSGIQFNNSTMILESIDDIKIMQFTGLLDKNGNEIYEGDLITQYDRNGRKPHPVIYYEPLAAFCGDYGLKYPLTEHELLFAEVVGNIYENPELLNIAMPLHNLKGEK